MNNAVGPTKKKKPQNTQNSLGRRMLNFIRFWSHL